MNTTWKPVHKVLAWCLALVAVGLLMIVVAGKARAQPERSFTVMMPLSQWQKAVDMLADKPFKESAPIIGVIQQQIAQQQQPVPPPAATPPKPVD